MCYFCTRFRHWSLRLSVRTRDFHSLKRSSTLLGTTKVKFVISAVGRDSQEEKVARGSRKSGTSRFI